MPRVIDYPRASLKNALALAQAVDELGGHCAPATAADRLGKKVSGAFKAVIGAATKYGFISNKKGKLSIEKIYRDYKLAYTPAEQQQVIQRAFLSVPLFQKIYGRFKESKLPIDHFERLLIREFDVPDEIASRIAAYFIDGGRNAGLLREDYSFNTGIKVQRPETNDQKDAESVEEEIDGEEANDDGDASVLVGAKSAANKHSFSIRIQGPGIDSVVLINEEDDLAIVRMIIKKIEKSLSDKTAPNKEE